MSLRCLLNRIKDGSYLAMIVAINCNFWILDIFLSVVLDWSWWHLCQRPWDFRRVQVRGLSPKDFVDFLVDVLGAEGAVCGENFRFGFKAAGDAAMLKELGRILGRWQWQFVFKGGSLQIEVDETKEK